MIRFNYGRLKAIIKSGGRRIGDVRKAAGINTFTWQRLSEGKDVCVDKLFRLCDEIKCQPSEILEVVDD